MPNKRKMSEEDYQEELEQEKDELDKLVTDHADQIKDIIENISMVEQRLSLEKKEKCENNQQIEKLIERNKELSQKTEENMLLLSKLQEKYSELKEYTEIKVFNLRILTKFKKMKKMSVKAENDAKIRERGLNIKLLEFLQDSLEEKDQELECPVCFESAKIPIFMCMDSHLICGSCQPKLKTCPECRKNYPDPPKRHRYAEKIAEEKKRLENRVNSLLKDLNEEAEENEAEGEQLIDLHNAGCKLFINLVGKHMVNRDLQTAFEKFGKVIEILNTGAGYAFVTFARPEDARIAMQEMDDRFVKECMIKVTTWKGWREGSRGYGQYGGHGAGAGHANRGGGYGAGRAVQGGYGRGGFNGGRRGGYDGGHGSRYGAGGGGEGSGYWTGKRGYRGGGP